jgi:hypothetical protein
MVAEILLLAQATTKSAARTYQRSTFWGVLEQTTTELELETAEERTLRWIAESRTDEEALVADMTDFLFDEELGNGKDDDEEVNQAYGLTDTAVNFEQIGDMDVAVDDEDITTDDAEMERPEETGTPTLQADTGEVKVGKKVVGKVKRAAINPHGFVDVECTGIERMRKKNLMVARHRKRERNRRRQKALEATLLNQESGSTLSERGMARLSGEEKEHRPCYVID